MSHDENDLLFLHVMDITEKVIASCLIHPKEVGNFAANDYNNEWCILILITEIRSLLIK